MTVYLVYRCYYADPSERQVRKFEAKSLLDWFRSIWEPIHDDAAALEHAKQLLGGLDIAPFSTLFSTIAEEGLSPPRKMDQVLAGFGGVYIEEEDHGPHHLQAFFEENENQLAVYLFDDQFRKKTRDRTDFLLHEGWELPEGDAEAGSIDLPECRRLDHPNGDGEGTLYSVDLFTDCKYNLEDLEGGQRVDGVRVPDLCRYLLLNPVTVGYGLRHLRLALEALLASRTGPDAGFLTAIRDNPADRVNWNAYSDWLQDHGHPPASIYLLDAALRAAGVVEPRNRKPALDLFKVTPHLAQACKHEGKVEPSDSNCYSQWIFFDDRWVAAHPSLAAGLLRFAARWDVLSDEED
jgi:uncharacterized protein (TIGR02996 family)